MHRLILNVNDTVLDKIFYFLNNLPKNDVKIVADEIVNVPNDAESYIDFSKYTIAAFKEIKDPAKWQNEIRNEWDS